MRSYELGYAPLFLNSTFSFGYDEFSVNRTDSLIQLNPIYNRENYVIFENERERLLINENLDQPEFVNSVIYTFPKVYTDRVSTEYILTPRSLVAGLS